MQTFERTKRKVAMISLPMKDRPREEIQMVWDRAKVKLEMKGYIVVGTLFQQSYADHNDPLWLLSLVLNKMSCCNTVYFCDGWEDARGCRIEHEVAEEYGLNIIYQEKEEPLASEEKAFLDGIRYAHDKLKQYSSEELGTILNRMEELTETTEERFRAGELYYLGDRCE
jgi:hypothetical protein